MWVVLCTAVFRFRFAIGAVKGRPFGLISRPYLLHNNVYGIAGCEKSKFSTPIQWLLDRGKQCGAVYCPSFITVRCFGKGGRVNVSGVDLMFDSGLKWLCPQVYAFGCIWQGIAYLPGYTRTLVELPQ